MPYCKYLKHKLFINYDNVAPCCWYIRGSAENPTIPKIDHLEAIAEMRKFAQTVTGPIPQCMQCTEKEKLGLPSPRINSYTIDHMREATDDELLEIDFQIDERCNSACIQCGSFNSTTWQQYNEKTTRGIPNKETVYIKRQTRVDERLEKVKNFVNFDTIKKMHFVGGEPLDTDTHVKVLKLIKNPESVHLAYTTNCSIYPNEEVFDLWSRFKNIYINFSMDGIEDHFEYIRWPLQWHQCTNNLKRFATANLPNIIFKVSVTALPFNILYMDRYNSWAREFFKDTNIDASDWFLTPNACTGLINLSCVPDRLADVIRAKYPDSQIAKMILPFNQTEYSKFMNYINYHDQHRKQDWKSVFPEVVEYFPEIV